jgi:hypothetical protein
MITASNGLIEDTIGFTTFLSGLSPGAEEASASDPVRARASAE